MHLLLPLLASLLFVGGLIFVKRVSRSANRPDGVTQMTLLFCVNQATMLLMSGLWFLDHADRPIGPLWQPATIAVLFMLGLLLTFTAVEVGDVSIATPVFGVKVLFVATLLAFTSRQGVSPVVWAAAGLAAVGIALIQWTGQQHPRRIGLTIAIALMAATCYATYDVLVQRWSPGWGTTRFLPIVFWIVAVLSLGMLPKTDWSSACRRQNLRLLIPAAGLLAAQAFCITIAVSSFGDAARVNVVYALRGLWGVLLAYAVAKIWGGEEAALGGRFLLIRLLGAAVLTLAVVLAILSLA